MNYHRDVHGVEFDSGRVEAAERIRDFGGSGLYPCDVVISCTLADLSRADPFPTPFVTLSVDLETSVKHNTILCAAVVIDRGDSRTEHEFRGDEKDILEGMTRLVRDEDPDFITGYNIDNFDLPQMNPNCTNRNESVVAPQALHLLNGDTVNSKIKAGNVLGKLTDRGLSHDQIVNELYVVCLSRLPTDKEKLTIKTILDAEKDKKSVLEDVFWSLLNSREFLFNH